jgi:hypothetical protein
LYIAQLRAAPLAPYDEGAAERSEAGGEKNVLSSLPQSKIGPKVPIFASSLTEGAKAAFGGKRNDKSRFIGSGGSVFGLKTSVFPSNRRKIQKKFTNLRI